MTKHKTRNITFAALFTALICITSQVAFVTPTVPFTLQILGIALCGYVLPLKWAVASIITYLSVGILGLPVFSGFKGGVQALIGPSGGFLFGFISLAVFCSISKKYNKTILKLFYSILGLVTCHCIGILQYSIVTGNGILGSFVTVTLPFFIKDTILVILAHFVSKYLIKALNFRN